MNVTELKKVSKIACIAVVLALLSACGGGGGDQPVDKSKYTGATARASINTGNAVAFTTDAYAAGSIGSSANVIGVMVQNEGSPDGKLTTLPEIAATVRGSLAQLFARGGQATTLTGVAASSTVYGAVGGSAAVTMTVNESTGNFTGTMTFSRYQNVSDGPTISGTVTMTGIYSPNTGRYDSITMECAPLSATTAKGTATIYGSFAFSVDATSEKLKMSCTVSVNSSPNYWVKDWTYTFTAGTLTITGVYYHPSYGYVEVTTPTPLNVSSISGVPSSGVFQAAGAHCSKARLTFSSSGSVVTATGGDGQDWQLCNE
ncbi:hypothetical protein KOM00_05135 [Geomonas sp. Red69]|uniref:hypothetical protein n=1 Tax=Geomonas diazotrophica TaxID=2843197 RepID=UPI001C0FC2AB|nr:hypothetical protein [Geomonas diazotrophica]MBU5636111.1 hypothetical protein [Geomonas diazotrophica]